METVHIFGASEAFDVPDFNEAINKALFYGFYMRLE